MCHKALNDGLEGPSINLEISEDIRMRFGARQRSKQTIPSTKSNALRRIDMSGSSMQVKMIA